ncbi:carbohydrate esterase family 5 protein, partial [Aulographum hederae CBS 113979]
SLFAALSLAAPTELVERQTATSNDVTNGACKPVTFVFARGSTEGGNMGTIVGSGLCAAMKKNMPGAVACQGVGGAYKATLAANFEDAGTNAASIKEAVKVMNQAMTKCPQSKMVFGGYSQGSAVMLNAVQQLPQAQQDKMMAGVFYGYTKNKQNNGQLPGYPPANLKVFCRPDDGVCGGQLDVTAGHLAYSDDGS